MCHLRGGSYTTTFAEHQLKTNVQAKFHDAADDESATGLATIFFLPGAIIIII